MPVQNFRGKNNLLVPKYCCAPADPKRLFIETKSTLDQSIDLLQTTVLKLQVLQNDEQLDTEAKGKVQDLCRWLGERQRN